MIRRAIIPVCLLVSGMSHAQTRTLLQVSNDLIYSPGQNVAYASVPSTAATHPNTVIQINPATGTVIKSLFVGSEPSQLALSKDGTTLYVGLDGAGMVRQIDTASFTSVRSWNLPVDNFFGETYAEDIAVNPDDAQALAISLYYKGSSPRHAGVAYYRFGIKADSQTPGHTGSNSIEFGMDGTKLYGYNNESTEYGFRTMSVNKDGITVESTTPANANFNATFRIEKARAYFTTGRIWDYKKAKLLGTVALPSAALAVAPDIVRNRVTYLVNTETGFKLYIYNLTTMTLVRVCPTNGKAASVFGNIGGSLHRYGPRGIMFRSEGRIHFLPVVTGL